MKRKMSLLVSILLICAMPVIPIFADTPIEVRLNNTYVSFPDAQPFVDQNNRTQVPIRIITDALGGEANWNNATGIATIVIDKTVITLTAGQNFMVVDGKIVSMDTNAVVKNGRIFVPLKYIAEAIGGSTDWNGLTKTANIRVSKQTKPNTYDYENTQPYNYPYDLESIGSQISQLRSDEQAMIKEYNDLIAQYKKAISDLESDRDEQAYLAYQQYLANYSGTGMSGVRGWANDAAQKVRDKYNKQIKEYQKIIDDLIDERDNNIDYYDQLIRNLQN